MKERIRPVSCSLLALVALVVGCAGPATTVPSPTPTPALATQTPSATTSVTPTPSRPPETTETATPKSEPKPEPGPEPKLTPTLTTQASPKPKPTSTVAPSPKGTVAIAPTAIPAPTPRFIYTENFTKSSGGWWNTSHNNYDVGYPKPGQAPGYYLTLKAANSGYYGLDRTFGEIQDFITEVECTALSDLPGFYGIAFRMNDDTRDRYEFAIDYVQGGYALLKSVGGKRTAVVPWALSPLLKKGPNVANRLMVEVRGNQFNLYANGYLLRSYTDNDSPIRTGLLRVFGLAGEQPNVPFVFNNFGMSSLTPGSP